MKRRINEILFRSDGLTPRAAYLLGIFKASLNFSFNRKENNGKQLGYLNNVTISTKDLHQLIKIQILLDSDHKIDFVS